MSVLAPIKPTKYGNSFDTALSKLFPSLPTRAYLMKVLSQYGIGFISAEILVRRLKELIHDPAHLELFDFIRPLVLLRDQLEYSTALPSCDLSRSIRLHLTRAFLYEDFGFKICGGFDQNCGVFVNWVEKKSKAWKAGLRKGHQIIRINQLSVAKSTHQMVVDFFKISYYLDLEVKNIGMVPRNTRNLELGWSFVDSDGSRMHGNYGLNKELPVLFKSLNSAMIGMHIRATDSGITVTSVKRFSAAEEAKILPGDVIVEINDTRLDERNFEECLAALSCEPPFLLKIVRGKDAEEKAAFA